MFNHPSPLHCLAYPGESAPSLITRLAHAASPAWSSVLRDLGVGDHAVASTANQSGAIKRIATLAGLTEDDVIGGMALPIDDDPDYVRVGDFVLLHQHVSQVTRRVAPSVLATDFEQGRQSYHRLIWSIAPLGVDPSTGEMLIERCTCGRTLSWRDIADAARCGKCGQKLWLIPPAMSSGDGSYVFDFMRRLFNPHVEDRRTVRRQLPTPICSWSEGDIIDIVDTLAALPFHLARSYPTPDPNRVDIRALGLRTILGGEASIKRLLNGTLDEAALAEQRLAFVTAFAAVLAAIDRSASSRTRSYLKGLI